MQYPMAVVPLQIYLMLKYIKSTFYVCQQENAKTRCGYKMTIILLYPFNFYFLQLIPFNILPSTIYTIRFSHFSFFNSVVFFLRCDQCIKSGPIKAFFTFEIIKKSHGARSG